MARLNMCSKDASMYGWSHSLTRMEANVLLACIETSSTEHPRQPNPISPSRLRGKWSVRSDTHKCTCMCSPNLPYSDPEAGVQILLLLDSAWSVINGSFSSCPLISSCSPEGPHQCSLVVTYVLTLWTEETFALIRSRVLKE